MATENPQFIKDFDTNRPDGSSEFVDALDNFIREAKFAIKNSFPNVNSQVTATPTELNRLVGTQSALVTVGAAQTITGAKEYTGKNAYRGTSEVVQGARNFAVATGTDNYSATFDPVLAVYIAGAEYNIRFTNANTATTPSLSINGLAAKTLVTAGGGALVAGDIIAGYDYIVRYDGSNMRILNLGLRTGEVTTAKIADHAVTADKLPLYAAGDYWEVGIGDTSTVSPGTSYIKVAEFYMPRAGVVRTHMHLWSDSGASVFGRVFRNGSAEGVERNASSPTRQTFVEDIGINKGDLLQLHIKQGFGGATVVNWGLFILTDGATSLVPTVHTSVIEPFTAGTEPKPRLF